MRWHYLPATSRMTGRANVRITGQGPRDIVPLVSLPRRYCVSTFSGQTVDLDAPDPSSVKLVDIAAALSKICRFGAQATRFHSVAQHAMLVHDIVVGQLDRPDLAMPALHHDSHEAYAGDLPSPLKAKLDAEGGGVYEKLCIALDGAIAEALGFRFPPPRNADRGVIKAADQHALLIESMTLLHDGGAGVRDQLCAKGVQVPELAALPALGPSLEPEQAEEAFTAAHAVSR